MFTLSGNLAWAENNLHRLGVPVATFPGDEQVAVPYWRAMTYEPKGMNMPTVTVRGVIKVATKYGATIDEDTYEKVKRMAIAPEAADVYLDEPKLTPEERERRHTVLSRVVCDVFRPDVDAFPSEEALALNEENSVLYGALKYWGNSVRTMPEIYRERVQKHAIGCVAFSLDKTRAPDFPAYRQLVFDESEQYGRMWAATVWAGQSEDTLPQLEDCSDWMGRFVGMLSTAGAAPDLKKDYRNKNIAFKPAGLRHGWALVRASLRDKDELIGPYRRWKRGEYPIQQ